MHIWAQYSSVLNDKIELKTENFYKAIVEADNIFFATYLKGGQTKARIRVKSSFVGNLEGDVIISNLDNEKIRRKYKRDSYKQGVDYIFITKKDGETQKLLEDSISIPVSNNMANFSFNTPYKMNFWQPFDIRLFDVAVNAIREKSDEMLSDSTRKSFIELFNEYIKNKKTAELKNALAAAKRSGISFDFATYDQIIELGGTLECLAVKYSSQIMGEIYFNQNVIPKVGEMTQEANTAFAVAAMKIASKPGSKAIEKILNNVESYSPPSSECFPYPEPPSNKEFFVRAVIEIDAPETLKILSMQIQSGGSDWLAIILGIISDYVGEDLTKLVLQEATKERMSARKLEFANYFDRIKTPETAKTLIKLFDTNKDIYWKKTILATLGKYQYKETLPFMIKALKEDSMEEIRTSAAIAIGEINSVKGAKPLYDFIVSEKSILAKSIAIDALAKIADRSVQDLLKQIIKNQEDPKIRETAANAIEDNLFILRYGRKKN
jgi:hypothetical protein